MIPSSPPSEHESGLLTEEPLVPSEDFVNLISEDISPDRYGRAPELDTQDRMMWSEMVWLRRRMQFVAACRGVFAVGARLLVVAAVVIGVLGLLHLL